MSAEVKKRGLGRGLDALFAQVKSEEEAFAPRRAGEIGEDARAAKAPPPAAAVTDAAPVEVKSAPAQKKLPVDKLVPGAYQPRRRFDDEALENLAKSIGEHGVLQPLLVRPAKDGKFEIIAGERRWRAAQKAQVHEVPVIVVALTDREALEVGLVENLQREDLTAIEEAEGYARLMEEFGHTQEDLARHIGRSRSHIANTVRLLTLPNSIRRAVQLGQLSAGHARALVGVADAETLASITISKGLSVRELEKMVRRNTRDRTADAPEGPAPYASKTASGATQKDVDVMALEKKMTQLLGLKVTLAGAGSAGRISIEYKTLDQLDDLLARLSQVPGRG